MSPDLCSADLTTLLAFVNASKTGREALADDIANLTAAWDAALAACEFRDVENNPGPDIASSMANIFQNEEWVRTIHDTLVNAPAQNGVSAAPADQVDAAAASNGAAPTSEQVTYDEPEMVGDPVTSGFVNDPINAATGNFVHADRDVKTPGFAAVLDVVRTYNSRAADRRGLFGLGWTTLLDVSLDADVEAATAVLTFTDGARITFTAGDDGRWEPNLRRRLRLETTPAGWTLTRHHGERVWHFDHDGVLVGGEEGAARYRVIRSESAIEVHEEQSGRWVRYRLATAEAGALVTRVETSDGRACSYRYDDGHCIGVERAIGDIAYEHDDRFLVAIADADGVLQVRNHYDDDGRVLGQLSEHGRRTEFVYGDDGSTRITDDSGGPTNVLFHDRRANLQSMIGGNGAAMRASFDRHDRIVRHVDREGGVTSYEYDPDVDLDVIVRTTDPDGLFESHDHDDAGRLTRRVDRAGGVWTFEYVNDLREPSVTLGPEGHLLTTEFDDRGLPSRVTDADGVITSYEWDRDGQLERLTNGVGESTTFAYDPAGRLVEIRDPLGRASSFELDETGRVRTVTDADGLVSRIEYSRAGRVLAMANDGPGSFEAAYDQRGALAAFTDATGATVGFSHDESGRLVEVAGPDGAVTTQEFDAMGQLVAVVDPSGNRSTQRYDREGRSVETTDAHGRTFRRDVDSLGRTVAIVGPDGSRMERSYHPTGALASVTDPLGRRWMFEVDGLGRLTTDIDPNGGRTHYEYTPGSRVARIVTPAGREYRYSYDAAGRPAGVVDPDGFEHIVEGGRMDELAADVLAEQMARFRFDDLNRVVGWSGDADGAQASGGGETAPGVSRLELGPLAMLQARGDDHPAQFEYDQRGLLQSVVDPAGGTTHFLRDLRGRIVGSITGAQSTHVRYDASGAVAQRTAADGRVTSFHNSPAGRLESFVVDGSDIGRAFGYDDAGRVAVVTGLSGSAVVQYEYDPLGLLAAATTADGTTRVGHDVFGSALAVVGEAGPDTEYVRDADGLVVRRLEADGHATEYDRTTAGRLAGFTDSQAGVVALPSPVVVERDRAGRVTVDDHGRVYVYDVAGRIAEAATASGHHRFTYNDLGLLATDTATGSVDDRRRAFTYEMGGRLVRIDEVGPNGETLGETVFHYDAAGRRRSQIASDGSTVEYRWNDLDQLVGIIRTAPDGATSLRRVRFSGLGRPDLVDDLAIGWDDAITGKPVRVGDQRFLRSGLQVRRAEPDADWFDGTTDDPWGYDPSAIEGVGLGHRGELTVDGLVFMGARVYDPWTRSFLSHDPLPPVPGENGAYASPYSYGWCDPVNFVDPSGRQPVTVEEFEAWKEKQETNRFERAAQAMIDDPWGTLAMVGVIAVGAVLVASGVGTAIGAGILIGAAASATMGLATDNFSPRSVAIGGAFGAVTGGGVGGAMAAGFGESVVSQVVVDGRGFDDVDWGQAALGGATGGLIAGGAAGAGRLASGASRRFQGPAGDVSPATRTTSGAPRTADASAPGAQPRPLGADYTHPVHDANGNLVDDPIAVNSRALTRRNRPGEYHVVAHGNPSLMSVNGQPETGAAVGRRILREPDYTPGQAIRLLSCSTGAPIPGPGGNGPPNVGQQVANETRAVVRAPNKTLWIYPNGDLQVADGVHRVRTDAWGRILTGPNGQTIQDHVPSMAPADQGKFVRFTPENQTWMEWGRNVLR
jgi:RHS repeat-associated protein